MTRSTMIHYVTGVTNWNYIEWNDNSVSFDVKSSEGEDRITLFGMNPTVAKDFYERNTSPTTGSLEDKKRIQDLEKALELIAFGNVRVTDIGGIAKDALGPDWMPF